MAYGFLVIIILLALSACFSAAEAAFLSVSSVRIRVLVDKGDRRALLVEKSKKNMRLLLGALLLGQNVCDIATSGLATVMATRVFGDAGVGIATGLLTFIITVFVNLIPKAHGAHHAEKTALILATSVSLLMRVTSPFVRVIDWFVALFMRSESEHTHAPISEDEIKTLATMGVQAGTVASSEKELIERVFLFHDITANDVMTPAENIVALSATSTLSDALPLIISSQFSRFPVFEGTENNIVGVVHSKTVLEKATSGDRPVDVLRVIDIMAQAVFVPETKAIDKLLRELQKGHIHMAIVINEYGSVVGIVTLEDLLEELVGQIADESDIDELVIKRVDKNTIVVHGDSQISDVNRFFNTKIGGPDHRTIGWAVLKKLGSVPAPGQKIEITPGLSATIDQIDGRRIVKVRLIKTTPDV